MPKIYQNSGAHLYRLVWKASHEVMRYDCKSIAAQGFATLSDYAVLEVLLHKGSLPVNAIGEKVLLTSGSITTAIQRLEKRGLVVRERSEDDARVVLVHLTDTGMNLIRQAFVAHTEDLDQLFVELSEDERIQFASLMRRLTQRSLKLNKV